MRVRNVQHQLLMILLLGIAGMICDLSMAADAETAPILDCSVTTVTRSDGDAGAGWREVDLGVLKSLDWRQWGGTSDLTGYHPFRDTPSNHKRDGSGAISDITIGREAIWSAPDSAWHVSWENGAPQDRGASSQRFVYADRVGFTVAASSERETLTVWTAGYGGDPRLSARLIGKDGTIVAETESTISQPGTERDPQYPKSIYARWVITFCASAPDQHLHLIWTCGPGAVASANVGVQACVLAKTADRSMAAKETSR